MQCCLIKLLKFAVVGQNAASGIAYVLSSLTAFRSVHGGSACCSVLLQVRCLISRTVSGLQLAQVCQDLCICAHRKCRTHSPSSFRCRATLSVLVIYTIWKHLVLITMSDCMLVIHTILDSSGVIVYAESDSAANHINKNDDMANTTSDRQFSSTPQTEHATRIRLTRPESVWTPTSHQASVPRDLCVCRLSTTNSKQFTSCRVLQT